MVLHYFKQFINNQPGVPDTLTSPKGIGIYFMIDIQSLVTKKLSYVEKKSIEIMLDMVERNVYSTKLSTCDASGYGWDAELHHAMPQIAYLLREKGFTVTSQVNHGVTDWLITL